MFKTRACSDTDCRIQNPSKNVWNLEEEYGSWNDFFTIERERLDEQCIQIYVFIPTDCLIGNHTYKYMSLIGDSIIKRGERNEWVPTMDHTHYTLKQKQ